MNKLNKQAESTGSASPENSGKVSELWQEEDKTPGFHLPPSLGLDKVEKLGNYILRLTTVN
jgi:hypothetical protein